MKNKITKTFIAQFLPENPIIIEAGAHKGKDTIAIANQWPHAQIHAFEPTEIYEQLAYDTYFYSNIHTYHIALDAQSSEKKMYACSGKYSRLSSLHQPSDYFTKNPKFAFNKITVKTITLDDWAHQHNITNIDLIWLDAQGAELTILKGGSQILKNTKLLFLEANIVARYQNAVLYDELKKWVLEHDFEELAIDEEVLNGRFNVLFRKRVS